MRSWGLGLIKNHGGRSLRYGIAIAFIYFTWRFAVDFFGLAVLISGIKQETWLAIFTLIFSSFFGATLQRQKEKAISLQASQESNRILIEKSNAEIIEFARKIEDRCDDLAVKLQSLQTQQSLLLAEIKDIRNKQAVTEKDVVAVESALHTSLLLGHERKP